jgi:hypothetical protein
MGTVIGHLTGEELLDGPAGAAYDDIVRMAAHLAPCDKRAGEKQGLLAALADMRLDPHEELDGYVLATLLAASRVQVTQLLLHLGGDGLTLALEGVDVERLELALDEPARHRIRVVADNGEAHTVGLEHRSSASHERVEDHAVEVVALEVVLRKRPVHELCEGKSAKERLGPPGEPLVHPDDRSVACSR